MERASKIAHVEIIKNPEVQALIDDCELPSPPAAAKLEDLFTTFGAADQSGVSLVIAIDGGCTETYVRQAYPSAQIAFFTFGPLLFKLADLRTLEDQRFIAPEDLQRLKQLERYTLVLPIRGVRRKGELSLSATVRRTIHEFFARNRGNEHDQLLVSLRWFLFRRWAKPADDSLAVEIPSCPSGCGERGITFRYVDPDERLCPNCGAPVYLTDVFRLHERVDEETGGGGIVSYVMTMLEQLVLVHLVYNVLRIKPDLLGQVLFIKDGPLAFFGVVAPLYRPMRDLIGHLMSEHIASKGPRILLAGLEKSGAFVEHAAAISDRIPRGSYAVLGDSYIRRYVVPGGNDGAVYGNNTYYGQKVLFRADSGELYVATVPATSYLAEPAPKDLPHLELILGLIGELRCSMYDNALIPVALANKLVSLSDHPSQRILTTFVRQVGSAR